MLAVHPEKNMAQKLTASHLSLRVCMDSLKSSAQGFSTLKPKLETFTDCIIMHLQIQNEEFFRILDENYRRENPDSQKALFFKAELKSLQVQLYSFMEDLDAPTAASKKRLTQDLRELIRVVSERIEQERAYMIPYCD